jgi:hypothetical protein
MTIFAELYHPITKLGGWFRRRAAGLGALAGWSLFLLLTVFILGGTVLWGPWVTLALALVYFGAVSVLA